MSLFQTLFWLCQSAGSSDRSEPCIILFNTINVNVTIFNAEGLELAKNKNHPVARQFPIYLKLFSVSTIVFGMASAVIPVMTPYLKYCYIEPSGDHDVLELPGAHCRAR